MSYIHGQTKAADMVREAESAARRKVAELDQLNAELDQRIAARKAALKREPKIRTYRPTVAQVRAWEAHKNTLPEPQWGGQHNLYLASLEAATWDRTHRRGKRQDNAA